MKRALLAALFPLGLLSLGTVGCGDGSDGEGDEELPASIPSDVPEPTEDGIALDAAPADFGKTPDPGECTVEEGTEPDFAKKLGCPADFEAVAANPLDASIPGARSAKTVIDRWNDHDMYFQNSKKYQIHWQFCSQHIKPAKPLSEFNQTEYYAPDRRFLLGAVTYYEEPGIWAYEIAPYDTSTAEMIQKGYEIVAQNAWFGEVLYFHPTSQAVEKEALKLPASVKVVTTKEMFKGITYQPYNLGVGVGRLRFLTAEELPTAALDFRDLVVLDAVPNDIGVVMGIITGEFQTPLSHINVLSQNRGTPNMALIGAMDNSTLRPFEKKWIELTVGPFEWSIRGITSAEADAWWEANKPAPVPVPEMDLSVTDIRDIKDVTPIEELGLGPALKKAIPAFGGKASHYSAFERMSEKVHHPKAFGIPLYYYRQHMEKNNLDEMATEMMANPDFTGDPQIRDELLKGLREAIRAAPLDPDFEAEVLKKLANDFPGIRMRFRSSTNAEDLDGFTGAGLYTSKSGDPNDPERPVADAIRAVWASAWTSRAVQERAYRSIPHEAVGMALLCHRSFPDEEANGVALTGNLFDTSGLEPGFYINVQKGEASVVKPEPGISTDQIIYHYYMPGQPVIFISHSSLVPEGETVLTTAQLYALGQGLDEVHKYFQPLYGQDTSVFYAMDIEFKFDGEPGEEPILWIKQARPHPGWGLGAEAH